MVLLFLILGLLFFIIECWIWKHTYKRNSWNHTYTRKKLTVLHVIVCGFINLIPIGNICFLIGFLIYLGTEYDLYTFITPPDGCKEKVSKLDKILSKEL